MEPLLQARQLQRRFNGRVAVHELDLELNPGDVLGLLGPNGAGKSTCLGMLAGTLAPDTGQVRIAGIDLALNPVQAKAHIGYLPERPPLYPDMRVDEYLDYAARLRGVTRAKVASAVSETKQRCGLESMGRHLIRHLSQGYRQRLGIAQAIVHSPQLLILDEPTVALDPLQIREIRELIRDLGREQAVLLSTHILPEVQSICTRVLILHRGRMVHAGAVESEEPVSSLRIGLQQPPGPELLAALPGVSAVEPLDRYSFRLRTGAQPDAAAIARQAVEAGWGLKELTPERTGLEQIFLQHTAGDSHA